MTSPGRLGNNPEFIALRTELEQIKRTIRNTTAMAVKTTAAGQQQAKRFRIDVKTVTLALVGSVSVNFVWSTPMPSEIYNVDMSCSALVGMPTVTITNQTANGCTATFTPGLAAAGAICVALAVAPAQG